MTRTLLRVALAVFVCDAIPAAEAQTQATSDPLTRPLRVFIDCRGPGCDDEFFTQELTWIDHVRDQKDADLHLLVTTQLTGGGGFEYTLRLIGHGRWEGREDTFKLTAEAGEAQDTLRRALLQAFSLALGRYALETPIGRQLTIQPPAKAAAAQTTAAQDPWNYWVYRISFNSFLNGQRSDKSAFFNANASANRITDAWKIQASAGFNYNENRFTLSTGRFVSSNRGRSVNVLIVKSLTDHWSAGGMVRWFRSTFNNQRLNLRLAPGIEYNIFRYRESANRQLTFQLTTGHDRFKYDEITIFGRLDETKWDAQFLALLSLRQPFGTVRVTGETAHYLDDVSQRRASLSVDNELRLFRGFSLNIDGNYQVLHDQLYLPRGGATDEEIIARQRQLATSYRYFFAIGVTYRFGSINNNIVNQRFGGGF